MDKREKYFAEKAIMVTLENYNEILENDEKNQLMYDVSLSGIIINFDGLETLEDFKSYLDMYENTAFEVVDKNQNIVGYAFHSLV